MGRDVKRNLSDKGITLMELIFVMALLATVMAIATPTFSRFFGGRTLEEESRRFLALTRYARSEAISRSVMTELWIDPSSGRYGLNSQEKSVSNNAWPLEFSLADGLRFYVDESVLQENRKVTILFWPDGSIDGESLQEVCIQRDEEDNIRIMQADFGMGYFIEDTSDEE